MTLLWQHKGIFIFAALSAALATNAEAAPAPMKPPPTPVQSPIKPPTNASYAAQTRQPTLKNGAVFAGGITWQCQGNQCQASGAFVAPTVPACHALALQVGALNSFTIGKQSIDASNLAQCNAGLTATIPAPAFGMGGVPKPPAPSGFGFAQDTSGKKSPNSSPPASKTSAPATSPSSVNVRTMTLAVTGIGTRETADDAARRSVFKPLSVRTQSLAVTGTGLRESAEDAARRKAFRPMTTRTQTLTVTGTGSR